MAHLSLRAPAKINLFLRVVGRRADGYHLLHTLFQKVSLWDEIELSIRPGTGKISLRCRDGGAPEGPGNLAWRAAEAFFAGSGLALDLDIDLVKRIPAGGGLGGGSSDAAAVLKGLNELAGLPLDHAQLHGLASRLGADVPFFLLDAPAAIGRGTGTELEPVLTPHRWFVLVCPDFGVSTSWAYGHYVLTTQDEDTIFDPWQVTEASAWRNDLEQAVIPCYPQVAHIKARLTAMGAEVALMSGSGSTVFGVFSSYSEARMASGRLTGEEGLATHVVESLE